MTVLQLSLLHPVEVAALTECFIIISSEDYQDLDSIDVETRQKVVAIFTTHNGIDGPLLDRFPNVKVISTRSVGFDQVDLRAAAERDVRVGHTPGVLNDATAEVAMSLVLMTSGACQKGKGYAVDMTLTAQSLCALVIYLWGRMYRAEPLALWEWVELVDVLPTWRAMGLA